MAEEHGFAFPVLEGSEEVMAAYRVPGVPFAYGIDEEGVIRSAGFAGTVEGLEGLVRAMEE